MPYLQPRHRLREAEHELVVNHDGGGDHRNMLTAKTKYHPGMIPALLCRPYLPFYPRRCIAGFTADRGYTACPATGSAAVEEQQGPETTPLSCPAELRRHRRGSASTAIWWSAACISSCWACCRVCCTSWRRFLYPYLPNTRLGQGGVRRPHFLVLVVAADRPQACRFGDGAWGGAGPLVLFAAVLVYFLIPFLPRIAVHARPI